VPFLVILATAGQTLKIGESRGRANALLRETFFPTPVAPKDGAVN
jgi:hypothetical protein